MEIRGIVESFKVDGSIVQTNKFTAKELIVALDVLANQKTDQRKLTEKDLGIGTPSKKANFAFEKAKQDRIIENYHHQIKVSKDPSSK